MYVSKAGLFSFLEQHSTNIYKYNFPSMYPVLLLEGKSHTPSLPFRRCNNVVKAIHTQAWTGSWFSRNLGLPELLDNRHMQVARLSVLCTVRL